MVMFLIQLNVQRFELAFTEFDL